MNGRIFYLREQMLKDLNRKWTVEELAQEIKVSAPYLQQLFKKEMQISPIAFLRDVRLKKACELLETTFDNISEIRYKVGMPNDSHFTRDFKKKYGVTPIAFRKQYWEKIQAEKAIGQK